MHCHRYIFTVTPKKKGSVPVTTPLLPELGEGIRIYPIRSKRTVVAYRIKLDTISIVRVFCGGADYAVTLQGSNENGKVSK